MQTATVLLKFASSQFCLVIVTAMFSSSSDFKMIGDLSALSEVMNYLKTFQIT